MTDLWNEHQIITVKQELGIRLIKCTKHNPSEYGVVVGATIEENSVGELNYFGIDKEYAEFLYSNLVSWRKVNCSKNSKVEQSEFMNSHFFIVEKEEKGIIFAKCIRHTPSEYAVGIHKGEYVGTVYIGTDKQQAEKIYLDLISQH